MNEADMFSRCMARQQGDEASVPMYGSESVADSLWLAERKMCQEDLPLPPDEERGVIEGHIDFHDPCLVTEL